MWAVVINKTVTKSILFVCVLGCGWGGVVGRKCEEGYVINSNNSKNFRPEKQTTEFLCDGCFSVWGDTRRPG